MGVDRGSTEDSLTVVGDSAKDIRLPLEIPFSRSVFGCHFACVRFNKFQHIFLGKPQNTTSITQHFRGRNAAK